MSSALLEISDLSKKFAQPVLRDINFEVHSGTIHGLVGQNGAGKSTLTNIIAGFLSADSGRILLDGRPHTPKTVADANLKGVSLAVQEMSLIDNLSVAENIMLRTFPAEFGIIRERQLLGSARKLAEKVGLGSVDLHQPVLSLTLAQRQLVELAKALSCPFRLLILDEPTAALTEAQTEIIHELLRGKVQSSRAIIYISHRLDDVMELCDKVSVLRDGILINTRKTCDIDATWLIKEMSESTGEIEERHCFKGQKSKRLSVLDMVTPRTKNPIDLTIHGGEIVGLAGLAGSGRSELLKAIYGLEERLSGSVKVHLENEQWLSPQNASESVSACVGFIPEDRKTQGIFLGQDVCSNITISSLKRFCTWPKSLDLIKEREAVTALISKLSIVCNSFYQSIETLSGGNQQKALVGRWLMASCNILLLDEPTRGMDVGAKAALHDELFAFRDRGNGLLIVSSELEELMLLCDRIVVLSDGECSGEFTRHAWSKELILDAAFRAYKVKNTQTPNAEKSFD